MTATRRVPEAETLLPPIEPFLVKAVEPIRRTTRAERDGLGLRAYNPKTSEWEHTWTDTSAPGGFLVWRGRFAGGAIDLYGEWKDETGRPIRSRLTWSQITDRTAHWESHRSLDEGKTWTRHWAVDFTRKITK